MSKLVMNDDYNDFSEVQLLGGMKAFDILLPFLNGWKTKENPSTPILHFADYGCSGGKNSMAFMNKIYETLKADGRLKETSMQVTLTDLPANNFNCVYEVLHKKFPHLTPQNQFFLSTSTGSFYEQILPSNSVDVASSFCALHWLSPPYKFLSFTDSSCINISTADPVADKEKIRIMQAHGKRDLINFLTAREKELRTDGLLIFNCVAYDKVPYLIEQDEDVNRFPPCESWYMKEMGKILAATRSRFGLEPSPTTLNFVPIFQRSVSDIEDAINGTPGLKKSLKILHISDCTLPDPYVHFLPSSYRDSSSEGQNEDENSSLEKFVEVEFSFLKSWWETLIYSMLEGHPEAISWWSDELRRSITANPVVWKNNISHCMVCLQKV